MTDAEYRMPKEIQMKNHEEIAELVFVPGASSFLRHCSFVLRHFKRPDFGRLMRCLR